MEDSTAAGVLQPFLAQAGAQFTHVAQELGAWVLASPRTLAEIEDRTLAAVKAVGQQVLEGVCAVAAAGAPTPRTTRCGCGHQAD